MSRLDRGPRPLATHLPDGASGTPLQHLGEGFASQGPGGSHLSKREQKALREKLSAADWEKPVDFKEIYDPKRRELLTRRHEEAIEQVEGRRNGRDVELDGYDKFEVLPTLTHRCVYVTGPQGSGKSFWTAMYARNWKEQNPRPPKPADMSDEDYAWWSPGQVFLFSQVEVDESLDSVGICRVVIDDGLIKNPFKPSDLHHCLVIFDDIDSIRDPKLRKVVQELCDHQLEDGRKRFVHVVRTSHKCRNWGSSRSPLQESDWVVFFLNKGAPRNIRNYLKEYLSWGDDVISSVVGNQQKGIPPLPSRWVAVSIHAPFIYCSEQKLKVV